MNISNEKAPAFRIGGEWTVEGDQVTSKLENGPCERGWLDCAELNSDDNVSNCVVFGGLGGNDEQPIRYNDMWILKIERK